MAQGIVQGARQCEVLREFRRARDRHREREAAVPTSKPNTRQKNTKQARAYSDLSEIAAYYDIASSVHNKDILDIVERVADLEFQDLPAERALVRIRENDLHEARTRSCCS